MPFVAIKQLYTINHNLYIANNEASEMQSPQQLTFLKSRLVLPVTTYSKSTTRTITIVNNGLPTSQSGKYSCILAINKYNENILL